MYSIAALVTFLYLVPGLLTGKPNRISHKPVLLPVAKAWSGNSVNAVIFRHNSVTTFKNIQYTAFYDSSGHVVVAKRILPSHQWQVKTTRFTGNVRDAHNTINIMADRDGYLHMAWNQHNNRLHYCRSLKPGSLNFTGELSMTGKQENYVTYPEFYTLSNGNLLFLYREGGSGNGNLVVNEYDIKTKKWSQIQSDLINGQGSRNAYWQCAVGPNGYIYLSWVWRETPNVATNHDICFAMSRDNGKTWQGTDGTVYTLPITEATAEYVRHIPEDSDLINQTSMCVDSQGHPYIATYWRNKGGSTPQYYLIYFNGKQWITRQVSHRAIPFSLSGMGTRHIPLSRPQIMIHKKRLYMLFRDEKHGDKVSVAISNGLKGIEWKVRNLTSASVGMWEPSYDIQYWNKYGELYLFVEKVVQRNAEGVARVPSQMSYILKWKP